jgi:hypothetical protein
MNLRTKTHSKNYYKLIKYQPKIISIDIFHTTKFKIVFSVQKSHDIFLKTHQKHSICDYYVVGYENLSKSHPEGQLYPSILSFVAHSHLDYKTLALILWSRTFTSKIRLRFHT